MSSDGDGRATLLFQALPQQLKLPAAERTELRRYARALNKEVGACRGFTCLITNDAELQRLNLAFLGHDYPTDVLSFPHGGQGCLGEVAISSERAAFQSRKFGHTYLQELRILLLHGVLHLTGLDHETDRGEMASAEQRWRTVFGLSNTLLARTAPRETGAR